MDFEYAKVAVISGLELGDRNGGPLAMARRLASSLEHQQGFDPEDVLHRYLEWWRGDGFDAGQVAERVFDLVLAGMPNAAAVAQVHRERGEHTAGCNPAHRIAPLATCPDVPDDKLAVVAQVEAALTHFDPLAGDVSAAVAVLIRLLVSGVPWRSALAEAAAGRMNRTQVALTNQYSGNLHSGGYAPDVLGAAVHFLDTQHDFQNALNESLLFAGPANFCPVLVGAIGAVRY
jgi:ADP-ribosylglycohydrolase